jgi:hypothetical protein
MRTGSTGADMLMLVVPVVVSFGFVVFFAGGVDGFLNLIDEAIRQATVSVVSWIRSL